MITGLTKHFRFPHCKITHHLLLLRNIFKHKRFKYLTSEYLHHHWMWSHLQACVTGPLRKITLILYRDRQATLMGVGTQRGPSAPKNRGFRGTQRTQASEVEQVSYTKCENGNLHRQTGQNAHYLGSKFGCCHTKTRNTPDKLDVSSLLEHRIDAAGWLRAGRISWQSSTRDSIPVSYGHLVYLS